MFGIDMEHPRLGDLSPFSGFLAAIPGTLEQKRRGRLRVFFSGPQVICFIFQAAFAETTRFGEAVRNTFIDFAVSISLFRGSSSLLQSLSGGEKGARNVITLSSF